MSSFSVHHHRRLPSLRSESGQSLVEFALILPLFMLLVIGMADFGTAFNQSNTLNHVAAEGARMAAVNINPGGSTQTLQQYLAAQGPNNGTGVTVCIEGTGKAGDPVKVVASSTYNFFGIVSDAIGGSGAGSKSLKGRATQRSEAAATKYTPSAVGSCT
jgi:hypothetical protein